MSNLPAERPLHFNQKNLQDFLDCPRRFQLSEFNKLTWPAGVTDSLDRLERSLYLGNNFHLICHQFFSGIPISSIESSIIDPEIKVIWDMFLPFGENLIKNQHYSEQLLGMNFLDHRLIAKYDLIVKIEPNRYVIIDWKTSPRKPSREVLASRVQSNLYPFIFCSSGSDLFDHQPINPEFVEMQYWYPLSNDPLEIFPYSDDLHIEVNSLLKNTITDIVNTKNNSDKFPLTDDHTHCLYCIFRSFCDRGISAGNIKNYTHIEYEDLLNIIFDLGQIGEVEF